MAHWVEIGLEVDSETAEALVGLLRPFCPDGVVAMQGLEGVDSDSGWDGSAPAGPVSVRGYVPATAFTPTVQRQIEEAVWHISTIAPSAVRGPQFRQVQEEDWANNWKQYYHAQRIGPRLMIVPTWEDVTPDSDAVVIRLDPGAAFGTGLHPTTRLALRLLEDTQLERAQVLDVGTGSGVLAIGAVQLGAAHAHGLDTNAIAVNVARENAAANRLEQSISVAEGSLDTDSAAQRYDVVVANIVAKVLMELAPMLTAAVAPGGRLLVSGIIETAEVETLVTFGTYGFAPVARLVEGDWRAYHLEREEPCTASS